MYTRMRQAPVLVLALLLPVTVVTAQFPGADAMAPSGGALPPSLGTSTGNILVLMADDLGVDNIGAYGVGLDLPPTPNIDAMATNGVLFRNAWTNPTCSPTRATIQTGRYAFRTGIGAVLTPADMSLSLNEMTIPEMLNVGTTNAYAHGTFGKWHLSNDYIDPVSSKPIDPASGGINNPNLAGYSFFSGSMYGTECGQALCSPQWWQGPYPYDYFTWPKVVNGVENIVNVYATTDFVDSALAWLGTAPEPWFCYVPFRLPHRPFQAPPAALHSTGLPEGEFSEGNDRPYFKAMVEALDTEIGRLLSSISPAVLANTTVIFLGDNGTQDSVVVAPFNPAHGKGTVYEGGINVPFIVQSPLITLPGSESQALVNAADIFATVAEIAGVDLGTTLPVGTVIDSVSIVPHLVDPLAGAGRSFIFSESFKPVEVLPHCQWDEGLPGPGLAVLDVCGERLFAGTSTSFEMTGAAPNALAYLLASTSYTPTAFKGGFLGPVPIDILFGPVLTSPTGDIIFPIGGGTPGGAPLSLWFQVVVKDPAQQFGYAMTNTVRIDWEDEATRFHVAAVRNDQYKLIRVVVPNLLTGLIYGPGNTELFYDLSTDFFEENDLLAGTLTPTEQTNYDALKAELDTLLGP